MPTANITDRWLETTTLPEGTARVRYWDADPSAKGFGVVIGQRTITFIARHRVAGKQRDVTIGGWQRPGAGDDHGKLWTVARARAEARKLIGQMINDVDPVIERASSSSMGPTLGEAFDAHVARLKARKKSEATIATFEKSRNYLDAWLDRPIAELTGVALAELHGKIKRDAKPRAGATNEKGAPLANRVITNVGTAWASLNKKLEGALGNWNPAKSVDKDTLDPKLVVVVDLADWRARVKTMRNPIQRDGLVFALFTGLRSEDVRTIRFEHYDAKNGTLRMPDPKGGKARAFTIPVPKTCIEILDRRRASNHDELGESDRGWVFPALDSAGDVGPIGDLRQQVHGDDAHGRFPAESPHVLRHTYVSIAAEIGISKMDRMTLANHRYASVDVHDSYIAIHLEHLRACANRIEAALLSRMKPSKRRSPKK